MADRESAIWSWNYQERRRQHLSGPAARAQAQVRSKVVEVGYRPAVAFFGQMETELAVLLFDYEEQRKQDEHLQGFEGELAKQILEWWLQRARVLFEAFARDTLTAAGAEDFVVEVEHLQRIWESQQRVLAYVGRTLHKAIPRPADWARD